MIDGILHLFVIVVAVSAFVIFPWVQEVRGRELAQSKGAPVWFKGSPWVMALIGAGCAALYFLMFLELKAHIHDTALLVIATVLLALPTATMFVTLLALYHVYLWLRSKVRRN